MNGLNLDALFVFFIGPILGSFLIGLSLYFSKDPGESYCQTDEEFDE